MARHNRDTQGEDQKGRVYDVSYQPDWLKQVKVTRALENGRQSTKTLCRNETRTEQEPGSRIRTRIASREQKLAFTLELDDPQGVVTRIIVETQVPGEPAEELAFSIEARRDARRKR